jgi:hypothetical protein
MIDLNEHRVRKGFLGSEDCLGKTGAFIVGDLHLLGYFPDANGWEHVIVARHDRCPTWEEMCFCKDLFWDEETLVWQYHPPKSQYSNYHPYALHLWRQPDFDFPLPPSAFNLLCSAYGK